MWVNLFWLLLFLLTCWCCLSEVGCRISLFPFFAFVDKECGIVIIDFSTCSFLFDSCAMMRKLFLEVLLSFDLIYSDSCFFCILFDLDWLLLLQINVESTLRCCFRIIVESAFFFICEFVHKMLYSNSWFFNFFQIIRWFFFDEKICSRSAFLVFSSIRQSD